MEAATKFALRSVARRYQRLSEEISSKLDEQLDRLVAEAAPELLCVEGIGTDTAASLLIAAGDDPERLKNEAAFAHLPVWGCPDCGLFRQDRPPPPQPS